MLDHLNVNKSLCDEYKYEDNTILIKIKAFENLEKYSECLIKVLDMLFLQINIDNGLDKQQIDPEINEDNQFQMLHLFALFGQNDKKKRLTEYIQNNISSANMFNYLL